MRLVSRSAVAALVVLLTVAATVFAQRPAPSAFVPGEVIVHWRAGATAAEQATARAQARGSRRSEIARTHVELIRVAPGEEAAAIARFRANPQVLSAEPNYIRAIPLSQDSVTDVLPGDYYFDEQWPLHNTGQPFYCFSWTGGTLCFYQGTADADIDAPEAWPLSTLGQNVKVAVIDSGIDYTHPDLARNYDGGYDFVNDDADPMDDNGHGTHVSGTIAAAMNNLTGNPAADEGVVGVAPTARLLAYKVCAADGTCTDFAIEQGIAQAIADGARVINMSLGGPDFSQSTSDAVQDAWNAGLVIVAAAGNAGTTDVMYPAGYDHVVSVGAYDENQQRASFSTYGSWVDLSAPGNVVISTYPMNTCAPSTVPGLTGCYARLSGTSMASPHVAGAAALLWGRGDLTTNAQVVDALLNSADPQGVGAARLDSWTIHGGLNLYNAMIYGLSNLHPVADAGPDQTVTDQDGDGVVQVGLDGSGSHDPDGTIVDYQWSENGASIASGATPDVWLPVGVHTLTLEVTDDYGDSASDTMMVTVNAPSAPPVADDVSANAVTGTPVAITLGATDDNVCDLTFSVVQPPASGSLSAIQNQPCVPGTPNADSATVTYTPGAAGTFTFQYRASDGSTDSAAATVTVTVNAPPDLVMSSLSAPFFGGAGEPLQIDDTTTNQGGGPAAASVTQFYLSSNYLWDPSDVSLGARSVPALAAGAASSGSTTVVIPPGTSVGVHYLIALADAPGQIAESQETNNAKFRSLIVGPDLEIPSISAPAAAGAGGSIAVTDTTHNKGAGAADASTTAYYFSADALLDPSDVYLGSRPVPALAPGASNTGTATVIVPPGTATGTYHVLAVADSASVVAETSETNNVRYSAPIVVGPDLVISGLTAPSLGGAGAPIVVGDTVLNQGAGASPASTTGFYLSADIYFDASDPPIGTRAVPALAAGASSTASTTVTIPAGTATGNYYVFAKANADGGVVEADQRNNLRRSALLRIGPNLVVSALAVVPNKTPAGQTTVAADTVTNLGGGAAGATVTKFYLSVDLALDASDVLLGSRSVPALLPTGQNSGSVTLLIPANTAPGSYKIIAEADGDHVVDETSEVNTRIAYIQVVAP